MYGVLFPDAARVELDLGTGESTPEGWIQVLRTGRFLLSPKGPELNITEQMLGEMVENSTRYNEPPVDYDHLGTNGKAQAGEARAAGWFKKLEIREGGKLYGLAQWTKKAAELIKNGEYKYVSATFLPKFFDPESGKFVGARLLGAAITNYPFVQGMDPLALAAAADISLDERRQRVSQAVYAKFANFDGLADSDVWVQDYYDDHVIVRKGPKLFKLPYEFDEQLKVNFPSEAVEVTVSYQELSMPNENPNTELQAQVTQLSATVTELTGKITQLSAFAETEKQRGDRLDAELKAERAKTTVTELIRAGKLAKKQEAWALSYCVADPAGFRAFSENLDPIVEIDREHGSSGSDAGVAASAAAGNSNSDAAVKKFEAAIDAAREKNPNLTYGAAMRQVSLEQPNLYEAYRLSFSTYGGDDKATVQ